jgi:hypothetical protein
MKHGERVNNMGDISKNFNKSDFTCDCGCGKNNISPVVVKYCQIIRDALNMPVYINCGTRCQKYNDSLPNSVKNSSHITGLAADIRAKYPDGRDMANIDLGNVVKKLYKAGKLPQLCYCYIIKGSDRAIHFDIDKSKAAKRHHIFAF